MMALPLNDFDKFRLDDRADKYFSEVPTLKLDDLNPRHDGEIKVSIMLSTYNRQAQLQRTLETLARQNFREFEVLLNNDGSSQNLLPIVEMFGKYLNLKYFETPRTGWTSCPSRAFKKMFPHTEGEVILISHPEFMVDYDGVGLLYDLIMGRETKFSYNKYIIGEYKEGTPLPVFGEDSQYRWGILRSAFIEEAHYPKLDGIDWHSDLKNIQQMDEFWEWGGFAGKKNQEVREEPAFPWWFVGGTTRDCPVWTEMPEFRGHGIIDMWLCDWRRVNRITDVISKDTMCYHQPHQTSAVAPQGEAQDESKFARKVL